ERARAVVDRRVEREALGVERERLAHVRDEVRAGEGGEAQRERDEAHGAEREGAAPPEAAAGEDEEGGQRDQRRELRARGEAEEEPRARRAIVERRARGEEQRRQHQRLGVATAGDLPR